MVVLGRETRAAAHGLVDRAQRVDWMVRIVDGAAAAHVLRCVVARAPVVAVPIRHRDAARQARRAVLVAWRRTRIRTARLRLCRGVATREVHENHDGREQHRERTHGGRLRARQGGVRRASERERASEWRHSRQTGSFSDIARGARVSEPSCAYIVPRYRPNPTQDDPHRPIQRNTNRTVSHPQRVRYRGVCRDRSTRRRRHRQRLASWNTLLQSWP